MNIVKRMTSLVLTVCVLSTVFISTSYAIGIEPPPAKYSEQEYNSVVDMLASQNTHREFNRKTTAYLACFLGWAGGENFYLRQYIRGGIFLVGNVVHLWVLSGPYSLINGRAYFSMTNQQFDEMRNPAFFGQVAQIVISRKNGKLQEITKKALVAPVLPIKTTVALSPAKTTAATFQGVETISQAPLALKQGEILRASNDAVSNGNAPRRSVPSQSSRDPKKREKYISFGAALVAGILLSILANALHAWLGLTVLCIVAQKIVPPSAFDQFSIPYLSSYTLYSKEFLTFLITACCVETGQKFIPIVSHIFNVLNGAVKPVLTAVMIAMIAKFANPDISNLVLRPMEILGGATVFGLHFGKHVIKWPAASIPGPHTAWAVAELIATAVVVGLGVWVLV